MLKRIATSLVAAAVGATALIAGSPAMADTTPSPSPSPSPSATASPSPEAKPAPAAGIVAIQVTDPVVIKGRGTATVTARVKTVDAKDVSIDFEPAGRHHGDGVWSESARGGHGGHKWDSWERTVTLSHRDPDGRWAVNVSALGLDGKWVKARAYFSVKHVKTERPKGPRGTQIVGFDADPEPVKKNRKLTLAGQLKVASCYDGWHFSGQAVAFNADKCDDHRRWHNWNRLGWKKIHVFFQKKGSGKWEYVETVTTNPSGYFYTKIPAYWSGTWKVVFKGSHGLYGSAATDYVKVVR